MCQDDVAQLRSRAKVAKQLAGHLVVAGGTSGTGCTHTQVCPSTLGPGLWVKWRLI